MVEIIILACLISAPDTCREFPTTFMAEAHEATPHACLLNGQMEAIEWAKRYPDWKLKKIICQRVHPAKRA